MLKEKINLKPEKELFSSNDFQIEYCSLSRKSKCKTCKESIQSKSIAFYLAKQKAWFDLECFKGLRPQFDSKFKIEK